MDGMKQYKIPLTTWIEAGKARGALQHAIPERDEEEQKEHSVEQTCLCWFAHYH